MECQSQGLSTRLLETSLWPDRPERVELIETHISWVFLTREFAWKIKKPVSFDFLDFGTLEQRKHLCEEELRLNQRTAPDLYLDVVPICGTVAAPEIDGIGKPFEYALRMKRFDDAALLSRQAIEKRLTPASIDLLAETIAEFHGRIPRTDSESEFGQPVDISEDVLSNFSTLEHLAEDDAPPREILQLLENWSRAEGTRIQPVLEQRRSGGFVRECHGDLHLRNIVEINGRPCLFDCIEFNARFRWIDVMSEIAFLIMDLEDHDERRLSRRLLNRYLELTGDYGGLAVLRYYLVYRAMVRAKVNLIHMRSQGQSREQQRPVQKRIADYLSTAREDVKQAPPALIIMHGLSGSGKTTVSQQIIENCPVIRIRSDVERKRLHGVAETERAQGAMAEHLYSPRATGRTYAHLSALAATVMNAGYSVVVDATFLQASERDRFRWLARVYGAPFRIVACRASSKKLFDRILSRESGHRDASDAGISVLKNQLQVDTGLNSEPPAEVITVETAREDSVAKAISQLTNVWE